MIRAANGGSASPLLSRRDVLRALGVTAGAIGLGAIASACGGGDSTPAAAGNDATPRPAASGSASASAARPDFVVGVQGLPGGLDPAQELSNVGTRVTYSMFDTLLRRDFLHDAKQPGTGRGVLPMLATAWQRLDDVTLELKLRNDVTFHNGDAFTAADVKFTFDRLIVKPPDELTEASGYFSVLDRVEVVNDQTVRMVTKAPDPLLEMRLTSWAAWILPRRYYEEVRIERFAQAPVGTGPYRFNRLAPDDALLLDAFDNYWAGKPTAATVRFRVIPETAARVTALVNNEVGIITNVPPDQVGTLKPASGVEVRSIPLANVHVLRYNTRHPVLKDARLRRALNAAINRQLLVDTLWGGRAIVPRSHQFEEYGPLYNAERLLPTYNPDLARELVRASGYGGEVVTYRTAPNYYTNGLEAAQAIVEMWKSVGVNAEVKLVEASAKVNPPEVMVANWSNSSRLADPDGSLWIAWGKESPTQKDYWTPANPRFNELGESARRTLDQPSRYQAYQEMLDIWEKEAPGTVLYIPIENYAARSNVRWTPYSFYFMDLRPDNLSFV